MNLISGLKHAPQLIATHIMAIAIRAATFTKQDRIDNRSYRNSGAPTIGQPALGSANPAQFLLLGTRGTADRQDGQSNNDPTYSS
jgi:hypothetical protein